MNRYLMRIEIKQGEVERILNELHEAQEKIYECYSELENLGVITVSRAENSTPET